MKTSTDIFKFTIPLSYKIAVFGLLTLAAVIYPKPAHALLGNNYATECKEHGGKRGVASGDWVYWPADETKCETWAKFKDNKEICILWKAHPGKEFAESEIWRMLILTTRKFWRETTKTTADGGGARFFWTEDSEMSARLEPDRTEFQIAYKTYIDRHDLWVKDGDKNGSDLPPVEDASPAPTPDGGHKLGKGQFNS
jgi:hypothetical protein